MSLLDNSNNQEHYIFNFDPIEQREEVPAPIEFNFELKGESYFQNVNNFVYHKMDDFEDQDAINKMTNDNTHSFDTTERGSVKITDPSVDEWAPLVVPFIGNNPDIDVLEKLVNEQISEKGYNNMVLDWLDLNMEDELEEETNIIRKKQKKSREQIRGLKKEFKKRQNWNKKSMKKLAKDLGLTTAQVYKWHWDQLNKLSKAAKRS